MEMIPKLMKVRFACLFFLFDDNKMFKEENTPIKISSPPPKVKIKIRNSIDETLLPPTSACPILQSDKHFALKSIEYRNVYDNELHPIVQRIESKLGIVLESSDDIFRLFDCSISRKCAGIEFPPRFDDDLLADLQMVYTFRSYFRLIFPDLRTQARKTCGLLLQEFLQALKSPNRSLSLFFAHDLTLVNVLLAFGQIRPWPTFSSFLTVDVLRNNSVVLSHESTPLLSFETFQKFEDEIKSFKPHFNDCHF